MPFPSGDPGAVSRTLEHLFRREAGNMTAALTRVIGLENLALAEDVIQETLVGALERWRFMGIPGNPSGWLYRSAKNRAMDVLRRRRTLRRLSPQIAYLLESEAGFQQSLDAVFLDSEIPDEVLRLMLACCDPALTSALRVTLILKYVCGFSDAEIARALLAEETAVRKRLSRARSALSKDRFRMEQAPQAAPPDALESVRAALYLLFNEGYHSSRADRTVREDLCLEAMRLGRLLHAHPAGARPETAALLALMHFHAARLPARVGDRGSLVLLKEQDRSLWDGHLIRQGFALLAESGRGESLTRYHLEAGLAAHHCRAEDFASTDWPAILELYDHLLGLHPSPVVELNRAIALAQVKGPESGLAAIFRLASRRELEEYHFFHAALGELSREAGDEEAARAHFDRALALAPGEADRELLRAKLAAMGQ